MPPPSWYFDAFKKWTKCCENAIKVSNDEHTNGTRQEHFGIAQKTEQSPPFLKILDTIRLCVDLLRFYFKADYLMQTSNVRKQPNSGKQRSSDVLDQLHIEECYIVLIQANNYQINLGLLL